MSWYSVDNVAEISSPAVLVYPDRVRQNIRHMVDIAGDVRRLRPHVKTTKMREVVQLHLDQGINRFKCATIAEAEMTAGAGAADVLLAYQPVGPNVARFVRLGQAFPRTRFSAVVDDEATVDALSAAASRAGVTLRLFLDLDGGMHRTGIEPGPRAVDLYRRLSSRPGLEAAGLHMYDGHVRTTDPAERGRAADATFAHVAATRDAIAAAGLPVPSIVVGGTPTFPCHARRPDVECSPGTTAFWDASYAATLPDLPFVPALLVLTRVISRPAANRLCLDLGHKAIAAENPHPRVMLFGLEDARAVGHSEEHLVLETDRAGDFPVGTPVYGVPFHVCPTVALHDAATVVTDGRADGRWQVAARTRMLTI
jgi:D-serine deaminase-like pyridoxal phosphate-dependent protein